MEIEGIVEQTTFRVTSEGIIVPLECDGRGYSGIVKPADYGFVIPTEQEISAYGTGVGE